jgi:hypothetical protein
MWPIFEADFCFKLPPLHTARWSRLRIDSFLIWSESLRELVLPINSSVPCIALILHYKRREYKMRTKQFNLTGGLSDLDP